MRPLLLASFLALAILAGCDNPESARVDDTRSKLTGTWLRETEADGSKLRRVLALGGNGKFIERMLITHSDRAAEKREFAGEWSYDGTNLKRRYLQENGRQFSGGTMRYATFPIGSITQSELVINDNIAGREVSYRRVAEGAQP